MTSFSLHSLSLTSRSVRFTYSNTLFKFTRTLIRDYFRRQTIPTTSGSSKVSGDFNCVSNRSLNPNSASLAFPAVRAIIQLNFRMRKFPN